jgi:hypothetical protein
MSTSGPRSQTNHRTFRTECTQSASTDEHPWCSGRMAYGWRPGIGRVGAEISVLEWIEEAGPT